MLGLRETGKSDKSK